MKFTGQCLCGEVQFEAGGPTLFCVHCHCRFCRQAHGAAFVTWLGVSEEKFVLLKGENQVSWYQSSRQSRRGFCPTCGTTMFYASKLSPGEMHIASACIEGPVDREPQAHVFFDQHVPWIHINDGLPELDSESRQLEKYRQIDPRRDR